MKESSLNKRYITKLLASVVSGVIGMVIIAVVPKIIGPTAFGQFVYLQQFFIKIIGFLDAGSSIAFFTKLSAKPERKELISFYAIYSILVLLVLFLFFGVIEYLGFYSSLFPDINDDFIYFGILFGFFTWTSQQFIKVSDAYALTASVEIVKIVHKILSLCLLFFFINIADFDLKKYFYFHIISVISFIIWLIYLFVKKGVFSKKLLIVRYSKLRTLVAEFIIYCMPLLSYSFVVLFVGIFDIWLLQSTSGSTQTGYYGLAYSIAAICFIFTGAMTPVITREFSKSFEHNDLDEMRLLFERYIPMLYSLAAYFSVFIAFQSENVLAIFTDEKFKDAYLVLVVMAFYPIHQTYGQLSGSVFYATGQTKLYRNIGLISMLVGFLLTLLLVYTLELNALGLAFKMVISQIIGVNIQLYFNVKLLNMNINKFIWHQIYSIVFFVVAAILSMMLVNITTPLISFLVSGFLYTIFVILGLFIFPKLFFLTQKEIQTIILKIKIILPF